MLSRRVLRFRQRLDRRHLPENLGVPGVDGDMERWMRELGVAWSIGAQVSVTFGFDSGKSYPYHCAIMPRTLYAWYSLNELEAFAQREARFDEEIDAAQLPRLRKLLHTDDGSVRVSFRFGQQRVGYVTVELEYRFNFKLVCQRCLDPVEEKTSHRVLLVVLEDESMAASAPAGYEPIILSGERFQLAEVIEDELIVSLPLISRHARIEECGGLARNLEVLLDENEVRTITLPSRNH